MNALEFGQIVARYQARAVFTIDGDGLHVRLSTHDHLFLPWAAVQNQTVEDFVRPIDWWLNSSAHPAATALTEDD